METSQIAARSNQSAAPRYEPSTELIVSSKTLGTNTVYDLSTANVSRSGLLLRWQSDAPIPFIESTILEMTVDPVGHYLGAPVKCLGKVVRMQVNPRQLDGAERDVAFGIRIVQMDDHDGESWVDCLSTLERTGKRMLADESKAKSFLTPPSK